MKKILITADSAQDLFTIINEMMCNDKTFTYHPEQAGIVMDAPDNVEAFRDYVLSLGETCKIEEIEEVEKRIFLVTHTTTAENDSIPQAYNTLEEAKAYVDSETAWAKQDKSFDVYAPTKKTCNTTFVYHLDKRGFATLYERYDIKEITVNQ